MSTGKQSTRKLGNWWLAVLLAVSGIAVLYLRRWFNRSSGRVKKKTERVLEDQDKPTRLVGLTRDEAAARQGEFDLNSEIRKEDRGFFWAAVRQSLLSTYNIDLFGIALILYLLGNPLAAIGTSLVIVLNLILNVFQQMYTRKQLNKILTDLRPQAVVLRDGVLTSIEPATIVEGDYLATRAGDEFLVDGEILRGKDLLVEEINSFGKAQQYSVNDGDKVFAGSYCLEGQAIYKSSEAGLHRYNAGPANRLHLLLGELTPLQRFMQWVFRVLFGLVIVIGTLLVVDSLIVGTNLVSRAYQDAFSILFGIAPTSLFFILIITYAVGVLRISDRGALVFESQSIETLANSSLLCISEESLVSKLQVDLEMIEPPAGTQPIGENLVRRILGDFLHSLPELDQVDQMLAEALPGTTYRTRDAAPSLRELGWQAAAFDEPDLRGTLVLGFPDVLAGNLTQNHDDILVEPERGPGKIWTRLSQGIKSRINRGDDKGGKTANIGSSQPKSKSKEKIAEPEGRGKPAMNRFLNRIDRLLSPMEDQIYYESLSPEQQPDLILIFAYLPEPVKIIDDLGRPILPENLTPMAHVRVSAIVRPEGGQTILDLIETGLGVKILSSDSPVEAKKTAVALELPEDRFVYVSGDDTAGLQGDELTSLLQDGNIIGDLAPSQKAAIIEVLQSAGERILMVGNTVHDVPAMLQANLRMALRNSAQAAVTLTDIVMLKDSLEALPRVITTGQRLVNGILDLFKLYLSQTIAQLLLVLSILAAGFSNFLYHPTQAGIISLFTIAIPAVFLSVWAAAGRITASGIRRQLTHFILPSAITVAILSWGVYIFFLNRYQNVEYAQLAVTYALLMAGWLRVLFVQPPAPVFAGGAPLRGDRRVVYVVAGTVLLFLVIISMPFFQEIMRITWLRSPLDYLLTLLSSGLWAILTLSIWRSKWLEKLVRRI